MKIDLDIYEIKQILASLEAHYHEFQCGNDDEWIEVLGLIKKFATLAESES